MDWALSKGDKEKASQDTHMSKMNLGGLLYMYVCVE